MATTNRNVPFQQTTDLIEKLRAQKVVFGRLARCLRSPRGKYYRVAVTDKAAHTARQLRAPHETPARFAACHFQ